MSVIDSLGLSSKDYNPVDLGEGRKNVAILFNVKGASEDATNFATGNEVNNQFIYEQTKVDGVEWFIQRMVENDNAVLSDGTVNEKCESSCGETVVEIVSGSVSDSVSSINNTKKSETKGAEKVIALIALAVLAFLGLTK